MQVPPHADDAITGTSIVPSAWTGPPSTGADGLNDAQRQAAMIVTRDQTWLHCPNCLGGERPGSCCRSPPRITDLLISLQTPCGLQTPVQVLPPGFCSCLRRLGYGPTSAVPSSGEGVAVKAPLYKYAGLPGFLYPRSGQTDSPHMVSTHSQSTHVYTAYIRQACRQTGQSPEASPTGPLMSTPHKSGRITCTRHSTSIASYSRQRSHQT